MKMSQDYLHVIFDVEINQSLIYNICSVKSDHRNKMNLLSGLLCYHNFNHCIFMTNTSTNPSRNMNSNDQISQTQPSYGEIVAIKLSVVARDVKNEQKKSRLGVPMKKIIKLIKASFTPDMLNLMLKSSGESGYSRFYCGAGTTKKEIFDEEGALEGSFLGITCKRERIEKEASSLACFSRQQSRFVYSLHFAQPMNDAAKKELQALVCGEWDIERFFQIIPNAKKDFEGKEELEQFRRNRRIRGVDDDCDDLENAIAGISSITFIPRSNEHLQKPDHSFSLDVSSSPIRNLTSDFHLNDLQLSQFDRSVESNLENSEEHQDDSTCTAEGANDSVAPSDPQTQFHQILLHPSKQDAADSTPNLEDTDVGVETDESDEGPPISLDITSFIILLTMFLVNISVWHLIIRIILVEVAGISLDEPVHETFMDKVCLPKLSFWGHYWNSFSIEWLGNICDYSAAQYV